jgi:uncharacterized NAD-dependent epimerase/dehydratase family protein
MSAPVYRKLGVLIEDARDLYRNKTAMAVLRFRPEDVLCVIDPTRSQDEAQVLQEVAPGVPVVGELSEAIELGIEWLVVGVVTPGGFMPEILRPLVYAAIRARIGVITGLHQSFQDPNLIALSARYAVEVVNLRKPPEFERVIATGKARSTKARRVMTVGTDANIGKTTAALALERFINRERPRRHKAAFVSTSQDGRLVTGRGVAIDRVIADFAAGWTERLVLEADHGADLLIIEGQNSVLSPYSGGTALSLLHGGCPDMLILCHNPTRTHLRHTDVPVPALTDYVKVYEALIAPLHPGKVVAISLNTVELDERAALAAIKAAAKATGLPCADPIRHGDAGCRVLADAVSAAMAARAPAAKRPAGKAKTSAKAVVKGG